MIIIFIIFIIFIFCCISSSILIPIIGYIGISILPEIEKIIDPCGAEYEGEWTGEDWSAYITQCPIEAALAVHNRHLARVAAGEATR
jgi:hypothetical protein